MKSALGSTLLMASVLLAACSPTQQVVTRGTTPPNAAPGLSGAPAELAAEAYPVLARVANELSRGTVQTVLMPDYNRVSDRCDRELTGLSAWSPSTPAVERRRQSLVLGACRMVLARKMDPAAIDRALGLFALALSAEAAPLPPSDDRV